MASKVSVLKTQKWTNILFVIVFFGMATLFVMPAEAQAQSAQVPVTILGEERINQVLPNVTNINPDSTQVDQGLARADTLIMNVIRMVLRVLQFAAVAYIVYIGARMVTHVGSEDMLEKNRHALANTIIGFVVMSIGDNALNVFNPVNFQQGNTLEGQITLGAVPIIANVIDVLQYAMWVVAITLVVLTAYRMIVSPDKDITKSRQQLVWIGVGLFIIQIADFIVQPFDARNLQQVESGNALISNITNVLLTFFAPAAFFMFLYGAFVLVTANGDESKMKTARNIIVGTVIAAVLAFSSFAIISEIIRNFS